MCLSVQFRPHCLVNALCLAMRGRTRHADFQAIKGADDLQVGCRVHACAYELIDPLAAFLFICMAIVV